MHLNKQQEIKTKEVYLHTEFSKYRRYENKKTAIKQTEQSEMPKRISKLWQASEKYSGTGKIVDMRAVMK